MSTRLMVTAVSVALGIAGSVFATHANACAYQSFSTVAAAQQGSAEAQAAALLDASAQGGVIAQDSGGSLWLGPIVGLWSFTFTAPDGVTNIDWGFQQWHDDGTELTNSGGQLPATGNFCMGTWKKGNAQYKLNHWAIAWSLPGTDPSDLVGLVNIRELVTVNYTGNKMSGTFTEDLYDKTGTTLLMHLGAGTVAGTRITP